MTLKTKRNYGLELPAFLLFFAATLAAPIEVNFIIYRTCYVIMGRDESDCAKLGLDTKDNATRELETDVQEVANYLSVTLEFLSSSIPCILCMFIGPYSDKRGRRNILIISLTGIMISAALRIIVALFPNLSPWYLIVKIIPTMLTGGLSAFISVAFCYVVDVTNVEKRTLRISLVEGAVGFGMILGVCLSSHVFASIGYIGTFVLSFYILVLALCFVILFVPESIRIDEKEETKFFTLGHLKELWHTTFKPRAGYNRAVLLGCIAGIIFLATADENKGTEGLLLRSKFHWELTNLTNFASIRALVAIVVMCASIYVFHNLLKISESALIVAGFCANAIGTAIFAFAQYEWQIYAAAGIGMFSAIIAPMIRSLVSKIIPRRETGKVFSFCIVVQSFLSLLARSLYKIIYTETIDVFPGAFDLIPCMILIGITFYFVYVYILTKRPNAVLYLEQTEANRKFEEDTEVEMLEKGINN